MSYGFLHGTKVETGYGACVIERMTPGDRVLTLAGKMARIVWVGHTTVSAREVARVPAAQPIRLPTATAASEALIVAPEQAVVHLNGTGSAEMRLISAKSPELCGARLPVRVDLRFTHLMLEQDGLMLVNGVWCQSMTAKTAFDSVGYETQSAKIRLAG
ncbi:MAG: Hint domain-containing protein [Pseudomonadota bacterium]